MQIMVLKRIHYIHGPIILYLSHILCSRSHKIGLSTNFVGTPSNISLDTPFTSQTLLDICSNSCKYSFTNPKISHNLFKLSLFTLLDSCTFYELAHILLVHPLHVIINVSSYQRRMEEVLSLIR